jgi:2'-5' RNA ligase
MPSEELHSSLTTVIAGLARRHGTDAFEPHVTLLGGLEGPGETLLSAARELALGLRPFEIQLLGASTGLEFFHCVFVSAAGTPALLEARARAREAFGVGPEEPFRPHLSLVYGDLGAEEREFARLAAGDLKSSFVADALHVVDTSGPVPGWRRLESFPFSSSLRRGLAASEGSGTVR